jgi:hypothetical protein
MRRRLIYLGGILAALAVVAVLYVLRPESQPAPTAASPTSPSPATPSPKLQSELKSLPPQIRGQVESALRDAGATDVRVASLDRSRLRGSAELQWLFTPPTADAPEWQRVAWDKYMAPLLYAEGHPRAGQWRDGVSPEMVWDSAQHVLPEVFTPDYLDRRIYVIEDKRIHWNDLQGLITSLGYDGSRPETARAIWERLEQMPDDPSAEPIDIQFPAPADDGDAWLARD